MPERARVGIIDDDPIKIEIGRFCLARGGHVVVFEARNMRAVRDILEKIDELKPDVVLVDGNLTMGDKSGEDGTWIAGQFNTRYPQVKLLGFSNSGSGVWGIRGNFRPSTSRDEMELSQMVDAL